MDFENLEKGDRILFNDRKTPLTVLETGEELLVQGPQGAEYIIYTENDTLLVCSKGKKKYSSYCKNLRKTGEWVETENGWKHSKSGAEIKVEKKDNGFWTVKTKGIEEDLEVPLYGFTNRGFALEEAEKFVEKNPEG